MASKNRSPARVVAIAAGAAALLLLAGAASAQGLYRSVGPDGRVTYSDRAPTVTNGKASVERRLDSPSPVPSATLPYELREVVSRYPVTFYTAADCVPCASARALLNIRGVPFAERTIASKEDIAALTALNGNGSLPFATLGSQQLRGFSEQEWQRFLDAAGYPKTSQLPVNWRAAAATPLAPGAQVVAPVPPAAARADAGSSRVGAGAGTDAAGTRSNNSNPAGIRF